MFLRDDPSATVFIDGRADPYPVNVWREYRAVVDGRNAWASILAAHRVDAVLVRRDSALDSLLADNPRLWASVGEEQRARLYVRSQILTLHLHFVNASTTRRFGSMEPWKT
jgi:hypothetical protein